MYSNLAIVLDMYGKYMYSNPVIVLERVLIIIFASCISYFVWYLSQIQVT
mgnify:CR=1 FL=1